MRFACEKFAYLGSPRRIWAIPAIHGDLQRLVALHDHIAARFSLGDRLVYLGNYLGIGSRDNEGVFDELLAFRSALLAKPGMEPTDIVHLRGPAEEAWQRLMRLQFAPVPARTLEQLFRAGIEPYLRLYGISSADTKSMGRADSVTITRWTNHLRNAQRHAAGHEPLTCSMRRAAITHAPKGSEQRLLFVPAGYNASRSLDDQGDGLWFTTEPFEPTKNLAAQYSRIVRGFDAQRGGVKTEGTMITLDGGCGFGGPLICGCFDNRGHLPEIITIGGQSALDAFGAREEPALESFDSRKPAAQRDEQRALMA